jgi:CubicO group peptidase (beta-lactamase class C family)
VEEGRIDLDRNVNDRMSWKVPENDFTREQKVTLRRILSHSAGLTVHGFPGHEAGKPLPTLVQVLNGPGDASGVPVQPEENRHAVLSNPCVLTLQRSAAR